jgi:hypothetical protein
MLYSRLRPVDTTGTVYHYCSAETFLNIIRNRTVRFSDVNLLNDAEEGRWGYDVFIESVNRVLRRERIPDEFPNISKEFVDVVDSLWSKFQLRLSSFIACFSADGDSLSQWRAYADDGQGFSIGFSAGELRRLPIQMYDVLYDYEQQIRELMIALAAIYSESEDLGRDYHTPRFLHRCAGLIASCLALKNPAWRDEKEVRCHHVVDVHIGQSGWLLSDGGGVSAGNDVLGYPIHFQARNGTLTPYLDMPFEVSDERKPITEIIVGPKCPNGPGNILLALGNLGYGLIPLKSAGSAYR